MLGTKSKYTVLAGSLILFVFMATIAQAILTDWTIDHLPIALGEGVTFTAVEDGKNVIQNYSWEFSCKEAGCAGDWVNFGNAKVANSVEHRVGTQSVRVPLPIKLIPTILLQAPPRSPTRLQS